MIRRIVDEFTDPADHLALDEAILQSSDEAVLQGSGSASELFRVWEFDRPVVVAGRSTRVAEEIDVAFCRANDIPVLRRCSGGASVLGGPGCLMYSVVLDHQGRGGLSKIDAAHRYVMQRVLKAVQLQVADASLQGTCDLTWRDRKCSGNALRITRSHLLYHGTLLYDFDLSMISRCLKMAPRQPEYRRGRDHTDFITNVPVDPQQLTKDLEGVLEVEGHQEAKSFDSRIRQLREQRYDSSDWHFRH